MSSKRLTPLLVGECPEHWERPFIEEVTELLTNGYVGPSSVHQTEVAETGIRYLQGFNVRPNKIDLARTTWVTKSFHDKNKKSQLREGDLLVVQSGHIGTAAVVPREAVGSNCHAVIICRFRRDRVNPHFASQYINSELGRSRLRGLEVGSSLPHINTSELGRFRLPLPPLHEQDCIARALSLWDACIEKTERLIAAKDRHLSAMREALIGGHRESVPTRLKTVTRESTSRNGTRFGRDAIMAVTKLSGMRPMKEETIAAQIDRYKVVRPRAFAYNPMRLNIGSIAMSRFESDVLVSPDYVVFECDEAMLIPDFLNHLRFTKRWMNHFELAGSGSVRVRIYYDDLATFTFGLPSLEDQSRIVAALDSAVREIELLVSYRDALKKQKRGLMQKLLTGQWRIPIKSPETTEASSC